MNLEHVEIVKRGAESISKWRETHPNERLDLRGADLGYAYLRGANLLDADLGGANLWNASLRGANLWNASLRGANLGRANLVGANLGRANLVGANLGLADLGGADLGGAKGIWQCGPGGSRGDMLYFVQHDNGLMVKCGCFWGTLAEFEAAIEKTHGDNQHGRYYRAAIQMAKAWSEG